MAMLPPSRWEDLATKADLREEIGRLDERLTGRLDAQDQRLDALDERLTGRLDALDERLTGRLDAQDQRLDALDERLAWRFESLEARLDTLQAVTVSSRQLGLTMIASVTAIGALAVTLAALA